VVFNSKVIFAIACWNLEVEVKFVYCLLFTGTPSFLINYTICARCFYDRWRILCEKGDWEG